VLLIAAGLMIRSFLNIYGMTNDLAAEKMLVMRLNLVNAKYPKSADREHFAERLLPRLQSLPGVESVALVSNFPIAGALSWRLQIEGKCSRMTQRNLLSRG
jgi:hypothetical protein